MSRTKLSLFLMTILLALTVAARAQNPQMNEDEKSAAADLLQATNEDRSSQGLGPLHPDAALTKAALEHAQRMVELTRHFPGRIPMDLARDVVFGHEFCCEIVDHGPGTTRSLKPGTLVCSLPMTLAGNTVQGIGYSNDIAGGFGQYCRWRNGCCCR